MKYTILSAFEELPYFTTQGFRQLAGDQVSDDAHARTTLYRWVKAGRLVALKKGVYMHAHFYERCRQEADFSAMVSAILQPQSYLSLEYVLQEHEILTEITYPVTAITPKNTRTITNKLGTFVYRHIQPDLYRGFHMLELHGIPVAIASPAKALFDYLYLRPSAFRSSGNDLNLAEELRLNLDEFTPASRSEFAEHVFASNPAKMGGLKMRQILTNLENTVWRP
jgi:predicted transcriptional regulator of viral defense system